MGENEELKSRFAALIQEHGRSMYRSARALLPGDAQAQDAVGEAVLRLPEEQRLAVTLYYYEDMPVAHIARTLGIPQGTVKSRLSRGRERLRQLLSEEDGYDVQRS